MDRFEKIISLLHFIAFVIDAAKKAFPFLDSSQQASTANGIADLTTTLLSSVSTQLDSISLTPHGSAYEEECMRMCRSKLEQLTIESSTLA